MKLVHLVGFITENLLRYFYLLGHMNVKYQSCVAEEEGKSILGNNRTLRDDGLSRYLQEIRCSVFWVVFFKERHKSHLTLQSIR